MGRIRYLSVAVNTLDGEKNRRDSIGTYPEEMECITKDM